MSIARHSNLTGTNSGKVVAIISDKSLSESNHLAPERMKSALSSIAQEIQRYKSTTSSIEDRGCDDYLNKLRSLRTNLKKKHSLIRRLKSNIKIACMIAKSVMSAKESECLKLADHLNKAKSEAIILSSENKKRNTSVQKMSLEVKVLQDKFETIRKLIELGYKELQHMRQEPIENLSITLKLKKILISCGQYYADYTNEHKKCLELDQKNLYLNNKTNILKSIIDASNHELSDLRFENERLRKEKSDNTNNSKYANSECQTKTRFIPRQKHETIDLSNHFSLVKKLLEDQDVMLKELKSLSEDFENDPLLIVQQ